MEVDMKATTSMRMILFLQIALIMLTLFALLKLQHMETTLKAHRRPEGFFMSEKPVDIPLAPCGYSVLAPGSVEFAERIQKDYLELAKMVIDGVKNKVQEKKSVEELLQFLQCATETVQDMDLRKEEKWQQIKELCRKGGQLFYYKYKCSEPDADKGKLEEGLLVLMDGKIVMRWPRWKTFEWGPPLKEEYGASK